MWLHFQQELKISRDLRLFLQVTGINTSLPEHTVDKTFSVQRNPMSEDAQLCMKVPKLRQGVLWIGAVAWRNWLRHCTTSRKIVGSILDGVIGIFH
jgi:hypothetical protein